MHLCRDCQHTCHGMPVLTAILRLFLLLLLPALGQAASLPLQASAAPLLPGPVMYVWADPEGQADIHHVRQLPESAWQPVARRDASFGYSKQAYWLRFSLHNPADAPINWILLIGNPLLDSLEAQGLVSRQAVPEDRRAKKIALSPQARPLIEKIEAISAQLRQEVFAGIDEDELRRCQKVHAQVLSNLEKR